MELVRSNNLISLKEEEEEIEKYDLSTEVTFENLIKYLMKKNLSNKVDLIDNVNDKTEIEENLIILIKKIIIDYNDKVDDLQKFIADNND